MQIEKGDLEVPLKYQTWGSETFAALICKRFECRCHAGDAENCANENVDLLFPAMFSKNH